MDLPGEADIHREFFTAIRDARPLAQAAGAEVRHTVALSCAAGEPGRTGRVVTVDPGPSDGGGLMFPIGAMSIALAGLVDGEPTPERILREAARLGLDGVEFYESDWGSAPGDLEEAACLAETAAAAGVRLFAIGSAARLGYHDGRAAAALETLRRQVDVAAAIDELYVGVSAVRRSAGFGAIHA